jgi:hypothetical protein
VKTVLRSGTTGDATARGNICYKAFKGIAEQHNFPPDFPSADIAISLFSMVLSRADVYSVIAEIDERVVGSNFLWEGDTIAGVGPITVVPAAQNCSVGRQACEHLLEIVISSAKLCGNTSEPVKCSEKRLLQHDAWLAYLRCFSPKKQYQTVIVDVRICDAKSNIPHTLFCADLLSTIIVTSIKSILRTKGR